MNLWHGSLSTSSPGRFSRGWAAYTELIAVNNQLQQGSLSNDDVNVDGFENIT